MSPRLTLTSFTRAISACVRRPALDVLGGAAVPEPGERRPVGREGHLRLVAEAHERFLAAEGASARGPGGDLVGGHGPGVGIVRVLAEGAVGAAVAAEVGDRQE